MKAILSHKRFKKEEAADGLTTTEGHRKRGQSLVEFALVLPVFLIMLLGVFEVGWALRGYLVLVNVNREAARFGARGIYLEFENAFENSATGTSCTGDPFDIGYCKVLSHTLDSFSCNGATDPSCNFGEIGLDMDGGNPNGAMIVTYYKVEPIGATFDCGGTCADKDCTSAAITSSENWAAVEYPVLDPFNQLSTPKPAYYNKELTATNTLSATGYYYHHGSATIYSRIDPADKVKELLGQNNTLNCQLAQKGLPPVADNTIVVENVFYQPQLVAGPFVEAFTGNQAIPLYSHTAMRVTGSLREDSSAAAACELYPLAIPLSSIGFSGPGDDVVVDQNTAVPENAAVGTFSFLQWDYTVAATGPGLASDINDPTGVSAFADALNTPGGDTVINIKGDWIASTPNVSIADARPILYTLAANKRQLWMPVWDDTCSTPTDCVSNANGFRIHTYVLLDIDLACLGNPNEPVACGAPATPFIKFQFRQLDANHCGCERGANVNCDIP